MIRSTADGIVPWPKEDVERFCAAGYWRGITLWEALASVAAERSDSVALVDGTIRMNYAELVRHVEGASVRLRRLGLQVDDRLIVQLPNSWQFAVLTLACFRAGIVPVMALPAQRMHELAGIARVAEARAIAVPSEFRDHDHRAMAYAISDSVPTLEFVLVGDGAGTDDLDLNELLQPLPEEGASTIEAPEAGAVALLLQSGGTTGLPKLIARTHDDYLLNIRECSLVAGLEDESVYLVALPAGHNFPLGCPGLLGTLLAGGTVVMLPSPGPEHAFRAIAAEGVTHAAVVPAIAQRWLEFAVENSRLVEASSLRVLGVGGSRLPDEIAVRIEPTLGCRLQQVFGMAEGLINMTRLDDPEEVITQTQGRPVSTADEVRILGPGGEDLPDGEPGLIFTRGPYTPRGYYRAPEANAESFVDGWYTSGDIVVRRPDGNLVVQGRDKDIINRGGEKISAEEIESLSYRLPAIELAAAVAMPDPILGERLCLFVTLRDEQRVTLDDIRETLLEAGLATFKFPERLEIVDQIPMTKLGKIDKKVLRESISLRMEKERKSTDA